MLNVIPLADSISAQIFNEFRRVTLILGAECCLKIQTESLLVLFVGRPTLDSAIQP